MATTPNWVDITATDAPVLRRFYAELLGWEVSVDESMDYGLISEGGGPPAGGIGQAGDNSPQTPGIVPYFPVDDLDSAVLSAGALGATVVLEPWELPGLGRMALITDPEGNRVGLMSS